MQRREFGQTESVLEAHEQRCVQIPPRGHDRHEVGFVGHHQVLVLIEHGFGPWQRWLFDQAAVVIHAKARFKRSARCDGHTKLIHHIARFHALQPLGARHVRHALNQKIKHGARAVPGQRHTAGPDTVARG